MAKTHVRTIILPDEAHTSNDNWLVLPVFLCFLLSGGTSLILEGTLTRLLRFVLGNTTLAVTTVLCAFMAGLALGSYVAGRLCDRQDRLLRMYGLMEGAVGVVCLVLPLCVQALQPVYHLMYLRLQDSPVALSLARFLLSGLLLLIPSAFMGATLPILTRWYSLRLGKVGRSVAGLYAINSTGAATGALLCGFVLLPGIGVTWTLRFACVADILICVLMLLLDSRLAPFTSTPSVLRASSRTIRIHSPGTETTWRRLLLLAYALSGAAAMIYEVAWTRGLALVVGSSAYAFSLMLVAFILGLAIGSATAAKLIDRLQNRLFWFAVVECAIGLSAMAALPLFAQLPVVIVSVIQQYASSFAALQTVEFAIMMLVMMIPTTLMGVAFPLVCLACAVRKENVGAATGSVYAANTVGGIVGAFTASFVLIPTLGTQNAILAAVAINVLIGLAILLPAPALGRIRKGLTAVVVMACTVGAFFSIRPWDPSVMASGAYLYADNFSAGGTSRDVIRKRMHDTPVIFHKEDMCTTVTVRQFANGGRLLAVGGKTDASTRGDLSTQLLLAHAPLLLHAHPHSALVIGLASGMTLGSAACYNLDRLDCAEISPAVVEASNYFAVENRHVLSDPRVRLIIGDGRNHLALTDTTYDVIISEPSNPWIAGVADLFTEEFFQLCRRRLAPGGLACVWLQSYSQNEQLFRSVVRTFHDTFPHMMIVESISMADYLLIGSVEPIRTPYTTFAERFRDPQVAVDLRRANITEPLDFLKRIVMSNDVEQYAQGAILHTDDNALLEFAAPRSLYENGGPTQIAISLNPYRKANLGFLTSNASQPERVTDLQKALEPLIQAQILGVQAIADYDAKHFQEAFSTAGTAARLDPSGPEILNSMARNLLSTAPAADAENAARLASAMAPNLALVCYKQASSFIRTHRWADAEETLEYAVRIEPQNPAPAMDLAWLLATCPDDSVRNGQAAINLATLGCQKTSYHEPKCLATLAAAQAEAGYFLAAIPIAQDALTLARRAGQTRLAEDIEAQISTYRQGKAFRMIDR